MRLLALPLLARRIRWARINFLRVALIFSGPTKKPDSSGNWRDVSAHLKLDCDGCRLHQG